MFRADSYQPLDISKAKRRIIGPETFSFHVVFFVSFLLPYLVYLRGRQLVERWFSSGLRQMPQMVANFVV